MLLSLYYAITKGVYTVPIALLLRSDISFSILSIANQKFHQDCLVRMVVYFSSHWRFITLVV